MAGRGYCLLVDGRGLARRLVSARCALDAAPLLRSDSRHDLDGEGFSVQAKLGDLRHEVKTARNPQPPEPMGVSATAET
jgi:hypothetical protein